MAAPWYTFAEDKLQPHRELMIALAVLIVAITFALLLYGDNVVLAAWIVYLLMP